MEKINDSNYEQWLVSYADGELDEASRREVERWLEQHPEAAAELRLYNDAPRLEADTATTYTGPLPGTGRQPRAMALRWAAAAAVVALAIMPLALHNSHDGNRQQLVAVAEDEPIVPAQEVVETLQPAAKPATQPYRKARMAMPAPQAQPAAVDTEADEATSPAPTTAEETIAEAEPTAEPAADKTESQDEPVYVDFLLVEETLPKADQQLIALKNATQEALQGSYLGRRLARKMPADEELADMMRERRARTPIGVLVTVDALLALNK
ncbi:MAG: hypothetical protein IJ760_07005 [Bacteroidales bacterium]|nr:hypothetical protein [Bacteroidales bacterium]